MNKPIPFIAENPLYLRVKQMNEDFPSCGTHNGYVAIPPTHPLYEADAEELDRCLSVHGGITWAWHFCGMQTDRLVPLAGYDAANVEKNWWIIGFDTAHFNDNDMKWNKKNVAEETLRLLEQ